MRSTALLIVTLTTPGALVSQDPIPECGTCRIEVERYAILRDTSGVTEPDAYIAPTVVRDSRGWYYVAPMADRSSIGVYRPDGRLEHSGGRAAQRFPVFTFLHELKIRGDTLVAVDRGARAIHLIPLTGAAGPHVIPIGYPAEGVLPLPAGGYVSQGNIRSPELIGLPIHIHDNTGRHIRAFGPPGEVSQKTPYDAKRHLALGGRETVLAGWLNRYRVEQWSTAGALIATIDQQRTWFQPWISYPPNIEATRPPPTFDSVRLEDGLLWCIFHVPDRSWAPSPDVAAEDHRAMPRLAERNRVFDTVIEVLDIRSRRLVASRRVDEMISGYLNDGTDLYTTRVLDESGNQEIHLLRLRLVRERE